MVQSQYIETPPCGPQDSRGSTANSLVLDTTVKCPIGNLSVFADIRANLVQIWIRGICWLDRHIKLFFFLLLLMFLGQSLSNLWHGSLCCPAGGGGDNVIELRWCHEVCVWFGLQGCFYIGGFCEMASIWMLMSKISKYNDTVCSNISSFIHFNCQLFLCWCWV